MFIASEASQLTPRSGRSEMYPPQISPLRGEEDNFCLLGL